ncbi:MAG: hypothetical protein EKK41_11150 [Hyphomicrobiales bacterium]|nr:MAG: hypothetical protein EKK41_11150 [Hyphomicrobiales bacterium]
MKGLLAIAVASCTILGLAEAHAQGKAPPPAAKVTQADVAKVVASIKADPAKMKQFCQIHKLQDEYEKAGQAKDEKKLDELDKSMDAAANAIGPEYIRVTSVDLDDPSAKLLDDLAVTCK